MDRCLRLPGRLVARDEWLLFYTGCDAVLPLLLRPAAASLASATATSAARLLGCVRRSRALPRFLWREPGLSSRGRAATCLCSAAISSHADALTQCPLLRARLKSTSPCSQGNPGDIGVHTDPIGMHPQACCSPGFPVAGCPAVVSPQCDGCASAFPNCYVSPRFSR